MRAVFGIALLLTGISFPAGALEYEKDIMPIFKKKCYECHSDEAKKIKGNLHLDDPAQFHGRFAKDDLVLPGKPKLSGLYYSLTRPRHDKGAMPPQKKGKQLSDKEVQLVYDWILEGAPIDGKRGKRGKPGKEKENLPAKSLMRVPQEQNWTNRQGKTIRAALLKVESGNAVLRMKNGAVYRYPVNQLSDESRAALQKIITRQ